MKILIVGAKGFIGSNCVSFFGQNHDVSAVGRTENFDRVFNKQEFDVCINASGSASVPFSFQNPENDYILNVFNVQQLLSAIRHHNPDCKLLNFSSASVYGNPEQLPVKENAPMKPVSPYGFHKLQSESLLTEYHRFFGLKTCSLRIFSAYGPGLRKQLFWDIYQKIKDTPEEISISGTGDESRDFIFIEDLMEVIDIVIRSNHLNGSIINVGSGQETTIRTAAETFITAYSPRTRLKFSGAKRIGDPDRWVADLSLLREHGFSCKITMQAGLQQYAKWLKEQE